MVPVLPPEILHLVAESLFPFSSDPKKLPLDHWDHGRPDYLHGTLANLCLVSKTFHVMATPVLYRLPMTVLKTALLARTLAERPDLAHHVRYLHDNCWNHWYGLDRGELGPKFKELHDQAFTYIERRVAEGEGGPLEDEANNDLLRDLRFSRENNTDGQVMDSIIISMCPNLEKLYVSSCYQPVLPSVPPTFLVNLTNVTVSHGDTELGMRFSALYYLAKAAPNISTLVIQRLAESGEADEDDNETQSLPECPSFPSVMTLRLENSLLSELSFAAMMRAFPRLEDLTYESDDSTVGDSEMLERQFLGAITDHASGLKALEVDTSQRSHLDGVPADFLWDPRLTEISNLESLTTDVFTLLPLKEQGAECYPADVLDNTLPTSLKTRRLYWLLQCDGHLIRAKLSERQASFFRLAEEVSTRFSHLREVCFLNLGKKEDPSEVRQAFEAVGVRFSAGTSRLRKW